MKDFKGVSTVIATILLIALTIVMVGSIAAFAGGFLGTLTTAPVTASISITASSGQGTITLMHNGGETIPNAFTSSPTYFSNVEVRVQGVTTGYNAITLNGTTVGAGATVPFRPGDIVRLTRTANLATGDVIVVFYKPANQILAQETVI